LALNSIQTSKLMSTVLNGTITMSNGRNNFNFIHRRKFSKKNEVKLLIIY